MLFRAAACTGALYHIDLYVVNGALPDLDAGVHHFGAHDFSLRRLRAGDHRDVLVQATARDAAVASAPALLVLTSTFWRNAWKYESRAYRHAFWDSGTISLTARRDGRSDARARLLTAFVAPGRRPFGRPDREAALASWHSDIAGRAAPPAPAPTRLDLATGPLSATEVDYPRSAPLTPPLLSTRPTRCGPFRSALSRIPAPPGPRLRRSPPATEDLDETIVRRARPSLRPRSDLFESSRPSAAARGFRRFLPGRPAAVALERHVRIANAVGGSIR